MPEAQRDFDNRNLVKSSMNDEMRKVTASTTKQRDISWSRSHSIDVSYIPLVSRQDAARPDPLPKSARPVQNVLLETSSEAKRFCCCPSDASNFSSCWKLKRRQIIWESAHASAKNRTAATTTTTATTRIPATITKPATLSESLLPTLNPTTTTSTTAAAVAAASASAACRMGHATPLLGRRAEGAEGHRAKAVGSISTSLPATPNLSHLRRRQQYKKLSLEDEDFVGAEVEALRRQQQQQQQQLAVAITKQPQMSATNLQRYPIANNSLATTEQSTTGGADQQQQHLPMLLGQEANSVPAAKKSFHGNDIRQIPNNNKNRHTSNHNNNNSRRSNGNNNDHRPPRAATSSETISTQTQTDLELLGNNNYYNNNNNYSNNYNNNNGKNNNNSRDNSAAASGTTTTTKATTTTTSMMSKSSLAFCEHCCESGSISSTNSNNSNSLATFGRARHSEAERVRRSDDDSVYEELSSCRFVSQEPQRERERRERERVKAEYEYESEAISCDASSARREAAVGEEEEEQASRTPAIDGERPKSPSPSPSPSSCSCSLSSPSPTICCYTIGRSHGHAHAHNHGHHNHANHRQVSPRPTSPVPIPAAEVFRFGDAAVLSTSLPNDYGSDASSLPSLQRFSSIPKSVKRKANASVSACAAPAPPPKPKSSSSARSRRQQQQQQQQSLESSSYDPTSFHRKLQRFERQNALIAASASVAETAFVSVSASSSAHEPAAEDEPERCELLNCFGAVKNNRGDDDVDDNAELRSRVAQPSVARSLSDSSCCSAIVGEKCANNNYNNNYTNNHNNNIHNNNNSNNNNSNNNCSNNNYTRNKNNNNRNKNNNISNLYNNNVDSVARLVKLSASVDSETNNNENINNNNNNYNNCKPNDEDDRWQHRVSPSAASSSPLSRSPCASLSKRTTLRYDSCGRLKLDPSSCQSPNANVGSGIGVAQKSLSESRLPQSSSVSVVIGGKLCRRINNFREQADRQNGHAYGSSPAHTISAQSKASLPPPSPKSPSARRGQSDLDLSFGVAARLPPTEDQLFKSFSDTNNFGPDAVSVSQPTSTEGQQKRCLSDFALQPRRPQPSSLDSISDVSSSAATTPGIANGNVTASVGVSVCVGINQKNSVSLPSVPQAHGSQSPLWLSSETIGSRCDETQSNCSDQTTIFHLDNDCSLSSPSTSSSSPSWPLCGGGNNNNNNNHILRGPLILRRIPEIQSFGYIPTHTQSLGSANVRDQGEKELGMEKRRNTLDRLQRLGFGRRSSPSPSSAAAAAAATQDASSTSRHRKSSEKSDRLRELTELLRGNRSPPTPPTPPPRKPRHGSHSASSSFEKTDKHSTANATATPTTSTTPSTTTSTTGTTTNTEGSTTTTATTTINENTPLSFMATPADDILLMDQDEQADDRQPPTSSSSLSRDLGSTVVGVADRRPRDLLKPNTSLCNLEALAMGREKSKSPPPIAEAEDVGTAVSCELDTKLRPESRTVIGSYTQKGIPFRSASFSQIDYSSGKYKRSALSVLRDRLRRDKAVDRAPSPTAPSANVTANITLPRRKDSPKKEFAEEPPKKEPDWIYIPLKKSELSISLRSSQEHPKLEDVAESPDAPGEECSEEDVFGETKTMEAFGEGKTMDDFGEANAMKDFEEKAMEVFGETKATEILGEATDVLGESTDVFGETKDSSSGSDPEQTAVAHAKMESLTDTIQSENDYTIDEELLPVTVGSCDLTTADEPPSTMATTATTTGEAVNNKNEEAPATTMTESESNLATLMEEEIPLESPPDNFLQTATTCLIPVPVYECAAQEWRLENPPHEWVEVAPEEFGIVPETIQPLVSLDQCSVARAEQRTEAELRIEGVPTISVSRSSEEADDKDILRLKDEADGGGGVVVERRQASLDYPEVKKRYSHDDMEIGTEKRASLDSFATRFSADERRRLDKSRRRKGMYIESADWVQAPVATEAGGRGTGLALDISIANFNAIKADSPDDCHQATLIYLNSPLAEDSRTPGSSLYSFDLNTPDSECSRPPVWTKAPRLTSFSCQSSEERDEATTASSSQSLTTGPTTSCVAGDSTGPTTPASAGGGGSGVLVRNNKSYPYLRTDSVSDNESDRTPPPSRDRTSPSPAPGDHDFKRYSKRPLRGPYGQMLEAEMKKPNRMHFEEILEELRESEGISQPRRQREPHEDPGDSGGSGTGSARNLPQYSNSVRVRKTSTYLPVPSHARAASTPSQIENGAASGGIGGGGLDKVKPHEKRYQSSLDTSRARDDDDAHVLANHHPHLHQREMKRSASEAPVSKTHSKRSQSMSGAKSSTQKRSQDIATPATASSAGKQKQSGANLMPSQELLAELLKGSSEKLLSEQRQQMFADTRTHVVQEIFKNEQSYVESLQTVVMKYLKVLKSPEHAGMIDSRTVDEIFFMVPDILEIHEKFLGELRSRLDNWDAQQKVGDSFMETFSKLEVLEVYTSFVNNCNRAKNAIRTTKHQRPSFAKFLETTAREHKGKLSLDNLLIKPVQKFPNYEMLFTRLIKHTDHDHPDQKHLQDVLKLVHDILVHINCKEREILENGQREATLRELEGVIEGMADLIAPERQFLLFDLVSMPSGQGARKERGFFLFNDLLVLTSIKKRSGTIRKPNTSTCPGTVASTLDTNKYKFLTKISLDCLEIVKTKDENVKRIMNEIENLAEDCNKLQQITEITASLKYPHQYLEDVIRELHRDVQRQLSERQTNDAQLNMLELTVNSPNGSQKLSIVFSKAEKRSQWEETFNEAKQKLAATLERHPIPEFLTSIPIRKTRAGLQFTCAAATLSEKRDVWVCNSDGYVGQVCIMSLHPEPNVTSCNGVCNARILCVASVPAYSGSSNAAENHRASGHRHHHHHHHHHHHSDTHPQRDHRKSNSPNCQAGGGLSAGGHSAVEKRKAASSSTSASTNTTSSSTNTSSNTSTNTSTTANNNNNNNNSDIQLDLNLSSSDEEAEAAAVAAGSSSGQAERVPSPAPSTTASTATTVSAASTSTSHPYHQHQDSNPEEGEGNQSTMWIGTEDGCIHVYNSTDNIRIKKNRIKIEHHSAVYSILYLDNRVFVSLANGDICVYLRDGVGWNTSSSHCISIGTVSSPVSKLLNVHGKLWCSIQGIIKVLDIESLLVVNQIQISSDSKPITNMTVSNNYVWISIQNSAHIKCFHSNSHQLITEVNLAPAVNKMLSNCDEIIRQHKAACLRVTSLLSCKDLIWIGTSAGVLLTIPAQGYEKGATNVVPTGIPHGHTGHVRFLTFVETTGATDSSAAAMGAPTTTATKDSGDSASAEYKNQSSSKHTKSKPESNNILIISGGDGYEDFRNSGANSLSEIAGREDSTNHLLIWQI